MRGQTQTSIINPQIGDDMTERDVMALLIEAHEEMAYQEDRYRTLNCCKRSLLSNGWRHNDTCDHWVLVN